MGVEGLEGDLEILFAELLEVFELGGHVALLRVALLNLRNSRGSRLVSAPFP
jgi:hypothetical protein